MASVKYLKQLCRRTSKMQLNNTKNIESISAKTNFVIFELPDSIDYAEILPKAQHIKPADGTEVYKIEDIRAIGALVHNKQTETLTLVFENAETIPVNAINAFLKLLEEPSDYVHYVFLTRNSASLLPTIKSRAHQFYLKNLQKLGDKPNIAPDIYDLAKRYISATPQQLPKLAAEIAKDKTDARAKALATVDAAIQILYKSYFATGNQKLITKLDNLIQTSEALRQNGHIKLHLVAGMI